MLRKRRLTVKASSVAMGHQETLSAHPKFHLSPGAHGRVTICGVFSRAVQRALLAPGARLYGGKLVGLIDQRTVRRVAEMLASDDPDTLMKGIRVVANSRERVEAIRNLDIRLAALLAARSGVALTPKAADRAADD
jgi:hypothetical protein